MKISVVALLLAALCCVVLAASSDNQKVVGHWQGNSPPPNPPLFEVSLTKMPPNVPNVKTTTGILTGAHHVSLFYSWAPPRSLRRH